MSVRPEILRDRRIAKAQDLCETLSQNIEYARDRETPEAIHTTVHNARSWERALNRVMFELEFYAALAAGRKTPVE